MKQFICILGEYLHLWFIIINKTEIYDILDWFVLYLKHGINPRRHEHSERITQFLY